MKIEGGCYCGQIRYTFDGDPAAAMQCHCRECQYFTGGNPNTFVMVPEAGFSYAQGEPKGFQRDDIEGSVSRFFCPECGTAIGTKAPAAPGMMIIKVGTIDDPSFYSPSVAIFTKDAQSFHHVPEDVPAFEELPG